MLSNQEATTNIQDQRNTRTLKRFKSFILGFCKCGCGEEIEIRPTTSGLLKQFKQSHNFRGSYHDQTGESNNQWKGGSILYHDKYWMDRCVGHPRATKLGHYVYRHIIVMEKHLGRYLRKGEVVHHKDENTLNNDISNLELLPSQSIHLSIHCLGKHIDTSDRSCFECGSKTTRIKNPSPSDNSHKTPRYTWHHLPTDKINYYCEKCYNGYLKERRRS